MSQEQFLNVIDRDEAQRRFLGAIDVRPREVEEVPLADALGRVLADDVVAAIDVPSFDRSNYDGYAVRAARDSALRCDAIGIDVQQFEVASVRLHDPAEGVEGGCDASVE